MGGRSRGRGLSGTSLLAVAEVGLSQTWALIIETQNLPNCTRSYWKFIEKFTKIQYFINHCVTFLFFSVFFTQNQFFFGLLRIGASSTKGNKQKTNILDVFCCRILTPTASIFDPKPSIAELHQVLPSEGSLCITQQPCDVCISREEDCTLATRISPADCYLTDTQLDCHGHGLMGSPSAFKSKNLS